MMVHVVCLCLMLTHCGDSFVTAASTSPPNTSLTPTSVPAPASTTVTTSIQDATTPITDPTTNHTTTATVELDSSSGVDSSAVTSATTSTTSPSVSTTATSTTTPSTTTTARRPVTSDSTTTPSTTTTTTRHPLTSDSTTGGDREKLVATEGGEEGVSLTTVIILITPLYVLLLLLLLGLCCYCCRHPHHTAHRVRTSVADLVNRRKLKEDDSRTKLSASSHIYDTTEDTEEIYLHPIPAGTTNASPRQEKAPSTSTYPGLGPDTARLPNHAPTVLNKTATHLAQGHADPREGAREFVEGGNSGGVGGLAEDGHDKPTTERGLGEGVEDGPTAARGFQVRHGLRHMEAVSAASAMARCVMEAAATRLAALDKVPKPVTPPLHRHHNAAGEVTPPHKTQAKGHVDVLTPLAKEEDKEERGKEEQEILPFHGEQSHKSDTAASEDDKTKELPTASHTISGSETGLGTEALQQASESVDFRDAAVEQTLPEPDYDGAT